MCCSFTGSNEKHESNPSILAVDTLQKQQPAIKQENPSATSARQREESAMFEPFLKSWIGFSSPLAKGGSRFLFKGALNWAKAKKVGGRADVFQSIKHVALHLYDDVLQSSPLRSRQKLPKSSRALHFLLSFHRLGESDHHVIQRSQDLAALYSTDPCGSFCDLNPPYTI